VNIKSLNYEAINLRDLYNLTRNAPKLKARNSKIYGVRPFKRNEQKRFVFWVKSNESYSSPLGWFVSFNYPDMDIRNWVSDRKRTPMSEDVKIFCSCPAWIYWGSLYWSNAYDYDLGVSENRYPIVRDPKRENMICKHAIRGMNYMRKKGFRYLWERFSKSKLDFASSKLRASIADFLQRQDKYEYSEIDEMLDDIQSDPEGAEDKLVELGVII